MKKIVVIGVLFFVIVSCSSQMKRESETARRLAKSRNYQDWEKAIKKYENVINLKIDARDKQFFLYMRLGDHYLYNNMWNDALKNYQAAEKIKPNNADVYYKQAVCLSQFFRLAVDKQKRKELLQKSINKYKQALLIDPTHTRSLYGLGILEFYFNYNQDKGVELMQRILKKETKNVDALFALGRFYYEMGALDKSLQTYKFLAKILPSKSSKMKEVEKNIDRIINEQ